MSEGEKLAGRIEKLIVDGQKEVLDRLGAVESNLRREIQDVRKELKQEIQRADKRADSSDKKADTHYHMLSYDIKEVDKKLDAHIRVPHAV